MDHPVTPEELKKHANKISAKKCREKRQMKARKNENKIRQVKSVFHRLPHNLLEEILEASRELGGNHYWVEKLCQEGKANEEPSLKLTFGTPHSDARDVIRRVLSAFVDMNKSGVENQVVEYQRSLGVVRTVLAELDMQDKIEPTAFHSALIIANTTVEADAISQMASSLYNCSIHPFVTNSDDRRKILLNNVRNGSTRILVGVWASVQNKDVKCRTLSVVAPLNTPAKLSKYAKIVEIVKESKAEPTVVVPRDDFERAQVLHQRYMQERYYRTPSPPPVEAQVNGHPTLMSSSDEDVL